MTVYLMANSSKHANTDQIWKIHSIFLSNNKARGELNCKFVV